MGYVSNVRGPSCQHGTRGRKKPAAQDAWRGLGRGWVVARERLAVSPADQVSRFPVGVDAAEPQTHRQFGIAQDMAVAGSLMLNAIENQQSFP